MQTQKFVEGPCWALFIKEIAGIYYTPWYLFTTAHSWSKKADAAEEQSYLPRKGYDFQQNLGTGPNSALCYTFLS